MPLLEKRKKKQKWFATDKDFDFLYSSPVQLLSKSHWTPLYVANAAAEFLATENGVKVMDIGSGAGKFCLVAAFNKPQALFYGVEQRKEFVRQAETVKGVLELENVNFIHGNFTQLDFRLYDNFYFYNSFYENLWGAARLDDSIVYSVELYNYYNRYLNNQLEQKPSGTRLVTFHSLEDEIPESYHEVGSQMDNLLKFWVKV